MKYDFVKFNEYQKQSEEKILNTISSKTGIPNRMLKTFFGKFEINNERYLLIFNWVRSENINYKQFKILTQNIKVRIPANFIIKGEPVGTNFFSMPEDFMVGG